MATKTPKQATGQDLFVEQGVTGVLHQEGRFADRQPAELQGAAGIEIMAEMLRKEPAIYTVNNMISLAARQAAWTVDPPTDAASDREAAEILASMMDDMSSSWWNAIQFALSAKAFGFADLHIVYKRRLGRTPGGDLPPSQFDDGLIGLRKLAVRRQETIDRWLLDDHGDPKFMIQINPITGREVEPVPIERLLHFRSGDARGSWEGTGWLEPAYRLYFQLERYEILLGIGHQRSFVGLPVFKYKSKPEDDVRNRVEQIGRNLVANEQMFVTYPENVVDFALVTVTNSNAGEVREYINQLRWEIMTLGIMQFFRLGNTQSGSRALADPLVRQFERAINGALEDTADVLNRHLVPRLLQVNPTLASKVSEPPRFSPSGASSLPVEILEFLDKIGNFLNQAGPEDQLWLRGLVGMPEITIDTQPPAPDDTPADDQGSKPDVEDDTGETDEDQPPAEDTEAASPTGNLVNLTVGEQALMRELTREFLRAGQLLEHAVGAASANGVGNANHA